MNCLEFRRQVLVDPRHLGAEVLAHRDTCPGCAEFLRSGLTLEARIEEAIAVPVDPALGQRILLEHRLGGRRRTRRGLIAAGLALVASGTALFSSRRSVLPDPVAVASIDHVIGEPSAFQARQSIAEADLRAALALSGASVRDPGVCRALTYLHDCPVPGGWGKHMVISAPGLRFTLITMPSRPVEHTVFLEQRGYATVVEPAAKGSVAVVAASADTLGRAREFVSANFDWRVS